MSVKMKEKSVKAVNKNNTARKLIDEYVVWSREGNHGWCPTYSDDINLRSKYTRENRGFMFYFDCFYLVSNGDSDLMKTAREFVTASLYNLKSIIKNDHAFRPPEDRYAANITYLTWDQYKIMMYRYVCKLMLLKGVRFKTKAKIHMDPKEREKLSLDCRKAFDDIPHPLDKRCSNCYALCSKKVHVLRCPNCMAVKFCHKDCLSEDRNGHRKHCEILSYIKDKSKFVLSMQKDWGEFTMKLRYKIYRIVYVKPEALKDVQNVLRLFIDT